MEKYDPFIIDRQAPYALPSYEAVPREKAEPARPGSYFSAEKQGIAYAKEPALTSKLLRNNINCP